MTTDTANDYISTALAQGGTIDITTIGRRSGRPNRIEIVFFNLGGRMIISGMPGPRDWYANLLAEPRFTLHLKRGVDADLRARATPITDEQERRAILAPITRQWRQADRLDVFVAGSPLVEFEIEAADGIERTAPLTSPDGRG